MPAPIPTPRCVRQVWDSAKACLTGGIPVRYCEYVKNVTVSLDEDTYRRARLRAAELGTSISALVKRALQELGSHESRTERLKRQEQTLRERVRVFRASDRLTRDEVHRRGA